MKKKLTSVLLFALILTLTACSKTTEKIKTESKKTNKSMTTTTTNKETTTTTTNIPEIDPEYVEVPKAPVYDTVDLTNYTKYYFSTSGDDSNDGLSEANPKQSIDAFNNLVKTITEPTEFLFKAGDTFEGNMVVSGYTSTEEKPLVITKYGDGDYAKITTSSKDSSIVSISGENIRFSNFEIYGIAARTGISVSTAKNGASKNFVVSDNYIHDICWNWTIDEPVEEACYHMDDYDPKTVCPDGKFVYSTCAIYFVATEGDKVNPRWFENVWITNNTIRTIGRSGIITDSRWQSGNGCGWGGLNKYRSIDDGWYPPKYVVISNNDIRYVGGDAIVTIGAEDCWIEYNTALHTSILGRYGYACAAIWPVCARRVYMQYNEAGYCRLFNGCTDGQGFDLDIGTMDCVVQYNYSHDNDGGGILICNVHSDMPLFDENGYPVYDQTTGKQATFDDRGLWDNNIIRNNVFAYNGKTGQNPALMTMSSDCHGIYVENNIIVLNPELTSQTLTVSADYGNCGSQEDLVFRNNIVYVEEETYAKIDTAKVTNYNFDNNLYYNLPNSFFNKFTGIVDEKAIRNIDPMIDVPEDRNGYDKIYCFMPQNDQVYTLGMYLEEMAKTDIAGENAQNIHYLGAFAKKIAK